MTCNVSLAGNREVSLEFQCFTAELITYIVCECNAPEWFLDGNPMFTICSWMDILYKGIGAKPNLYCEAIELVCGGSPIGCGLVERKPQLRGK